MKRVTGLAIAGLVLMVGVTPSWGQGPSWNPTASDANENTAGGTGALQSVGSGGSSNTAFGFHALFSNTTGDSNTASGIFALESNTTGSVNTASGYSALLSNTTGPANTASGYSALQNNTTGAANTASGGAALLRNTTGAANTALGYRALLSSTGNENIAVGQGAGSALTSGNRNIYLGHPGASSENRTMRLGYDETKKTFMAGVATSAVTGTTVLIAANGRLGVPLSSARYKRDIETMGARSEGVLKLRPVTFAYTSDKQGGRQYGLIAEEVATVYPELVTHTATGEVQAVRYQELIPMLVNELQRQQQAMEKQQQVTEHLQRELAELRSVVGQMRGGVAQR
jgi:hypothetical protein